MEKEAKEEEEEEEEEQVFGEFISCCSDLRPSVPCSSAKSVDRPNSLHQLLGGGIVADVILWRRKEMTISILVGTISAWLVFEVWEYTLLSLLSNILLLLISILFLWAKAAQVLNRPSPPLPEIQVSEGAMNALALYLQSLANKLFSAFRSIALGKDTDLFYASASGLWFLSVIGNLASLTTSFYACLLILLIMPALYEKYGDCIDTCLSLAYTEVLMYEKIYERACFQYYCKVKESIREIVKEDS